MRQIIFPINSEIMILWPMVFLKKDYLAVMNEYLAYWGCLFVLFSFLKYLKFSTKRILWTVLILASLPALILESTSTQTNLIVAFLFLCSLYLFVFGTKKKITLLLFFPEFPMRLLLAPKTQLVFSCLYLELFIFLFLLKN